MIQKPWHASFYDCRCNKCGVVVGWQPFQGDALKAVARFQHTHLLCNPADFFNVWNFFQFGNVVVIGGNWKTFGAGERSQVKHFYIACKATDFTHHFSFEAHDDTYRDNHHG